MKPRSNHTHKVLPTRLSPKKAGGNQTRRAPVGLLSLAAKPLSPLAHVWGLMKHLSWQDRLLLLLQAAFGAVFIWAMIWLAAIVFDLTSGASA